MDGFAFEATIGLSSADLADTPYTTNIEAGVAAVARAVFAMGGARRVTVVAREQPRNGSPMVDHLELHASWDDEGGAAWGLREDVERVAGAALKRA